VIRRICAILALAWLLGLAWFAVSLPGPSNAPRTDGIVVLTGAPGRLQRGLALLEGGQASRMLVSGVDRSVRRSEFEIAYNVPARLSACCVDLGKNAVDTVSNAQETAAWVRLHKMRTVRLVTTDWHMSRAQFELRRALGNDATVVGDAVRSHPSLGILVKEYNKLLARRVSVLFGG
jgi:uncharacterized SAM-binding protein YcdF (DUF218 family)